jgi:hypothetical protein
VASHKFLILTGARQIRGLGLGELHLQQWSQFILCAFSSQLGNTSGMNIRSFQVARGD